MPLIYANTGILQAKVANGWHVGHSEVQEVQEVQVGTASQSVQVDFEAPEGPGRKCVSEICSAAWLLVLGSCLV